MNTEAELTETHESMGDVLYKYRSMAGEARGCMPGRRSLRPTPEAVNHTLDILDNNRLYCPPPSVFNDPFECRAKLTFDAPEEVKNQRATERVLLENPGMSVEEAESLAPARWQAMEDNQTELLRWLRHDFGIASFGGRPDDILMWSHYAGSHNGICLQFQATQEEHVEFFGRAQRVRYQQELPVVNVYTDSPLDKAKAHLLTKAEHWRYEGEWRIIIPDAEQHGRFLPFPPTALSAVFLGACISDDNRRLVLERLGPAAAAGTTQVFQARVSLDAYRLGFTPVV